MVNPQIRFKKDDGTEFPPLLEGTIGNYYEFKNGLNKEKAAFGRGTPIVNYTDVYQNRILKADMIRGRVQLSDKEIENHNAHEGDVFFTRTSETIDEVGYAAALIEEIPGCVFSGFVLRGRPINPDLIVPAFAGYYFMTQSVRKGIIEKSSCTTRALTSGPNLSSVAVSMPCYEEQKKIAAFFTELDNLISAAADEVAALEEAKKGMMQKLFSREIRFMRDDGTEYPEWEDMTLGDVLSVAPERNGSKFTSDEYGVLNQIRFHGRSFAGEDISKYKVVHKGQIVYTRSPLTAKPYGIIKIVGDEEGVVSPLYIVNDIRKGHDSQFVYYMFDSPERTNIYLKPLVRIGAKHTMNISDMEWLSGNVAMPCHEEQYKIASVLSSMDDAIAAAKDELTGYRELKRGLLQQMFA